ncbi:jg10455 [Pararge aegeria aegeria]|uniref:Jg10455 protein n=2 Tax=Pararge aegeria aegeria TaxID=348720 RepID=A0A8S4RD08_9NEOP|nr:jg10455 [Pararge aegeria aegeria]
MSDFWEPPGAAVNAVVFSWRSWFDFPAEAKWEFKNSGLVLCFGVVGGFDRGIILHHPTDKDVPLSDLAFLYDVACKPIRRMGSMSMLYPLRGDSRREGSTDEPSAPDVDVDTSDATVKEPEKETK